MQTYFGERRTFQYRKKEEDHYINFDKVFPDLIFTENMVRMAYFEEELIKLALRARDLTGNNAFVATCILIKLFQDREVCELRMSDLSEIAFDITDDIFPEMDINERYNLFNVLMSDDFFDKMRIANAFIPKAPIDYDQFDVLGLRRERFNSEDY